MLVVVIIIVAGMAVFNVVGYLIEDRDHVSFKAHLPGLGLGLG